MIQLFKGKSRGLKNTRICFKMTDESSKSSDAQGCAGNTEIEIKVCARNVNQKKIQNNLKKNELFVSN